MKTIQKRLESKILIAKKTYKDKVEDHFRTDKLKDAWQGLKRTNKKPKMLEPNNIKDYANELNNFFCQI